MSRAVGWDELRAAYKDAAEQEDAEHARLVAASDPETKLAVVAWCIRAICEHAREGGSYRTLIYERLGFGPEAYAPLYRAGGLDISNEFDLPRRAAASLGDTPDHNQGGPK